MEGMGTIKEHIKLCHMPKNTWRLSSSTSYLIISPNKTKFINIMQLGKCRLRGFIGLL